MQKIPLISQVKVSMLYMQVAILTCAKTLRLYDCKRLMNVCQGH